MSEALETGLPTPVEGQEPVAQTQEPQEVEGQDEAKEDKPSKSYTQEDLDRIVRKVRQNARYTARKEAEAEFYRSLATQQQPVNREAVPSGEPKREQFEDYEAYIEARAEWKAEQAVLRREATRQQQSAYEARATEAHKVTARYQQTVEAARVELPDFDEVVEAAEVPITDAIRDAILDSSLGAKLTYHLAKHPEEVERISKLTPTQQVKAIGVLEATLSAPVKTTKAPAPVRPIGSASASTKDLSKMSMDEYMAWRKTQGFR